MSRVYRAALVVCALGLAGGLSGQASAQVTPGTYRVENRYSGKLLNVAGDASAAKQDKASVNVWFANDESTVQQWLLKPVK